MDPISENRIHDHPLPSRGMMVILIFATAEYFSGEDAEQ